MTSARIAAVIPAYKVREHLREVITNLPSVITDIVVVDDACPEQSGQVAFASGDPRVVVVVHEKNRGVGGAVKTGMLRAAELACEVIVKVDGDGQMPLQNLDRLLQPLLQQRAAYTKGNRFWYLRELRDMPLLRRIGNLALSFIVKAASGQWAIFDPTNGFVAIRADVARSLDLSKVADDYFFEISMLVELGRRSFRVIDIPMPAVYGNEVSSLRIGRVLRTFPVRLLRRGLSRFFYRHFWFGFGLSALYLLAGLPLLAWAFGFGGYAWWLSITEGVPATAGTVMLAALPFLMGFQLVLNALNVETSSAFNNRIAPDVFLDS